MPCCEKCWGEAYTRMLLWGGSQTDHYQDLLLERKDNHCTEAEQKGETNDL